MGFIARRLIKQDLENVQVLVNDTNNDYFNLVEIPSTFVQGRSAFKIFGSPLLKKEVPLKMEMLDAAGNTVFMSPVDLVGEEVPPFLPYRFITVEVYRPPVNKEGIGTLTILGELEPTAVDFQIPTSFQNTYNVKYSQKINIDLSTVVNSQPIRFYKAPFIQAEEIVKPRIVLTPVTQSAKLFPSGSAITSPDLKGKSIAVTTGSKEKEDDITPHRPNKDIEQFSEKYKYKTGLYGGAPPLIKRRGGRVFFASKEDPPQTISIPQGNLNAKMQGGTLTIPEHTTTVKKADGGGDTFNEEVTVPEFQSTIKEIISDTKLVLDDVVTFDDAEKVDHKIVDDFQNVPLTMSFDDVDRTIVSSSVHNDSFLNLTIKNLRTFSGDVYRVKAHGKMHSSNTGFAVLADTVIESPELLRDDTSISGFLRTGYFLDQNHINTYWSASSFNSNTKGAEVELTHTGSEYIDSLHLSGSTAGVNESIVAETHPDYPFILEKNVVYTLSALIKGKTTEKINDEGIKENTGKLYFHLSGSNLNPSQKITTNTYVGGELTSAENDRVVSLELDSNQAGMQDFNRVEHTFQPLFNLDTLRNTDTVLQLRATSGEWHISDLSLRPAQDTGFSPDEYNVILPLPRTTRPDKLDLFIEYFDINSNTVETVTIAENLDISGSAFIIDGLDNLLTGSLFMGDVAGAGIEMAGVNSAFMRSVGYKGFLSASEHGLGGFMIFSGSVLPDEPDNYTGAGLEIHDGTTGADESYLRFRTAPSILDVKTQTFFLGNSSNFISGSNGNIEITSSNFHLQPDGDVILQGTITAEAGGTVGGFTINANDLTGGSGANTIKLASGEGIHLGNAALASAPFSVTNAGVLKAESGTIGGWTLGATSFTGGEMTITSTGTIESNQFATNVAGSGFRLTADDGGFLEVENARIRGTLKTAVFEKETVNAVGGQLYVANSTVLTGSAVAPGGIHTAAQTTMSVENVSGFIPDEILSIKKVSATGFGTEYVKVVSASRNEPSSETDLGGLLFVERGFGDGVSGDSGSLGDTPSSAQTYSGSQVIVSTGKPPDTGYIRLNANPNDFTTPYMDIVERTGSGIYDVDLKVRLGDLSGLSTARLQEVSAGGSPGFGLYTDNVFLKGSITATTGSIGGVKMQDDKLFVGAGNHNNTDTGFYLEDDGKFSLKDKLVWDGSNLAIAGSITLTAGPTADQIAALGQATASLNTTTGSLASDITDAEAAAATLSQNLAAGAEASASAASSSASGLAVTHGNAIGTAAASDATTKANSVSSSASILAGLQAARIQEYETHVQLDNDGMELIAGSGVSVADYGDTVRIGPDANNEARIEIDNNSIDLIVDISGTDVTYAQLAATTTIGNTGAEHVSISSDGVDVKDASTSLSNFGSTVRVGQIGDNQSRVEITSGGLKIINRQGSTDTDILDFNADGDVVSNTFLLERTRLFGAGEDGDLTLFADSLTAPSLTSTTPFSTGPWANGRGDVLFVRESSGNWKLESDVYADDFTLRSSHPVSLKTNGFRLFVKNTLDVQANCFIHNDGSNGTVGSDNPGAGAGGTGGAGGAGAPGGNLQGGTNGSPGGAGGNRNAPSGVSGAGGGGAGGSGGFVFISARVISQGTSNNIRSLGGVGGAGGTGLD